MRKNYYLNIAAALWMGVAALAMTACSSEDNFENNQQPAQSEVHTYSVCIPASFGDAQTRAVVPGTEAGSGKENLVGKFMTTEKIMVYNLGLFEYAKSMGDYTFLQPDADGATTANLTGELSFSGSVAEGQTLKLMYNHTNTSALELQYFVWDSDPLKIQYQPGTLAGLSNYDFAVADVTISAGGISGTGPYALTTSAANFENQQSMFKFTFTGLPTGVGVQKLVVSSANKRIVTRYNPVTSYEFTMVPAVEISLDDAARTDNGAGVVYAAIRFQSGADDITFTVTGTDGNTYTATKHTTGFSNGKYYTPTIALKKITIDLAEINSDYTAQDGEILSGTLTKKVKISIADGATVTLKDAVFRCPDDTDELTNNGMNWAGITCEGNANIVLEGTNTARGFNYKYPGIYIPSGSTLTISGTGQLTASGPTGNYSCGIGGGYGLSSGNIVITSGTIIANGGDSCAGIGGGTEGGSQVSCGYITISGGTVTATSHSNCPGIGAGCGSSKAALCGDITLSGGNITVSHGSNGGGAAIGNAGYSTCSKVTITDGVQSLTMTNLKVTSKEVSKFIDATAVYVGTTNITTNIGLDVDNTTIQGYMTGLGFTSQSYDADAKTWSLTK